MNIRRIATDANWKLISPIDHLLGRGICLGARKGLFAASKKRERGEKS